MARLTHLPRERGVGGSPEKSGSQPGSWVSAANVLAWVYRKVIKVNAEMKVGPGAEARAAFISDLLTLGHRLPVADGKAGHVPVDRGEAVRVHHQDVVPVTAAAGVAGGA